MDSLSGVGVIDKSAGDPRGARRGWTGDPGGARRRDRSLPGRPPTASRSHSRPTGWSGETSAAGSASGCGSPRGGGRPTRSRLHSSRRRSACSPGCGTRRGRARSCTCATATAGSASRSPSDRPVCGTPCPSGPGSRSLAGSGAKVLLAWSDPDGWPDGVDAAGLRAVRQRGWAVSVAEREPGVASVSAPVRDRAGAVIAALSVSGPLDRLGRRPGPRFGPDLVRAPRQSLEQRLR